MRSRDEELFLDIENGLQLFNDHEYPLPGINDSNIRDVFINQVIDSIRRVKYIYVMSARNIHESRADPTSDNFDPLKAAVLYKRQGIVEEAFWLVFLSTHFGKNLQTGWRLARDVYGKLGDSEYWTWSRTSNDVEAFKEWLSDKYNTLIGDGVRRKFGNHRKYETLDPNSGSWTGYVIESYIDFIQPPRTHEQYLQEIIAEIGNEPRKLFDYLYHSMDDVKRFGRTAKFDFLTMLGKLELANIEPGMTYMSGATGPIKGAKLLFTGNSASNISTNNLEELLYLLEQRLDLGSMGMQVLEDALCNWQKNPNYYIYFGG